MRPVLQFHHARVGIAMALLLTTLSTQNSWAANIEAVMTPKLILFQSESGGQVVAELDPSTLQFPIEILKVSKKNTYRVTIGDVTGYVVPRHVKTDMNHTALTTCGKVVASREVAASRGIGDGCKKKGD
jgi:hypothetical protein